MTQTEQYNRWQQFHVFQAKMERKWRPVVVKALQAQIQQFIDYAEIHSYPFALMDINSVVTIESIGNAVQGIYRDAGVKWGYMTYREMNRVKRLNAGDINSALLDYIDQYFELYLLEKSVLPITEYTRELIRDQMTAGLAEGKSYEVIARSLVDDEINKVRALRIVRTETVRAANAGAVEGAKQTGLVMNKIWISAKDNRTRRLPRDSADHLHLDTQTIAMDGSFEVQTKKHGVVKMLQPGDPSAPAECTINCRCTCGFEAIRDQRGRLIRTPNTL